MEKFKEAYNRLNQAQRAAVDQIDGPVLVIAGPGTGKTQLLSVRVANILDKSDVLPENILCLTFTNKAAANMQLRLSKLVGSAGQKVMIRTFHSFAAEVMNMYPEYFWNGAKLTNVPDAVQDEIITDILSSLPLDNPLSLKFAGKYTSVRDVLDGLKLAKEAGLTPDKLRLLLEFNTAYIDKVEPELVEICNERLNYKKLDEMAMRVEALPEQTLDEVTRPLISLPTVILETFEAAHTADEGTGKAANTSAWKRRWVQSVEGVKGMFEERKRNDWWLHLADVYAAYRDILHQRGYYDYSDMIIEVISQVEQNADMRADIQEKFQYVLIDEFQDTNAAQLRLAHLVADHYVAEGNPNIMAVGDDDQSIYKFNGAVLSNMRDFARSYSKTQEFILTENYRSSQDVLDFSTKVINQTIELGLGRGNGAQKSLLAKNEPKTKGTITHIAWPTREHQFYGLAKHIAELKNQPGSVAVLARSHESLKAVANALHEQNIPVRYEQQQSILELALIKQITHVAEIITALSSGDETTVNKFIPMLLSHEVWQVQPLKLWQLALINRKSPHWIESLLASKDETLQTIAHWLLWLSRESTEQALPRMLELIIGLSSSEHLTSPLRRYFLEADAIDTPYLASISAVRRLLSLAQEFCEQGQSSMADFIRLIHVTQDNNRPITDESLFVTSNDAVELLTVYKAKGLEFDSVIVVDAMENIWKPSSKGRRPPANLPLKPAGDDFDDYVRLMFVAVSRAKRNILISSYNTNEAGDEAVPSAIIRDILPAKKISFDEVDEPTKVLESSIVWPRLEGSIETELLKDILNDYTLSPTAFLNFLDIKLGGPAHFLERHLLNLPEAQSTAAAFGSAMHKALEAAQQQTIANSFDIGGVQTAYEAALQKQLLNPTDYERYLIHGQQVLERLFKDYGMQLLPTGQPEVSLLVHINDVPLSGTLDRVDFNSELNELIITDYKTGTPLSSFTTRSKMLQVKAWRHRTQLELYELMARDSSLFRTKPVVKSQMVYVEAESLKELTRVYTPTTEDMERLARLVSIVHEKIRTLNLPDTRHYSEDYDGIVKFEEDLLNGRI